MSNVLTEDFDRILAAGLPKEAYEGKSFLITGATGLVGSLLCRFLLYANEKAGWNTKVLALVRNKEKAEGIFKGYDTSGLTYVLGDLEKDAISIPETCDYVIHAASVTASKIMVANPVGTIMTAISGTEKMLKLAVEKKVSSMVYISSMEIYGQPDTEGKTAEKDLGYVDLTSVRSCYPEGKRMCECLCTAYASQYGVKVTSARLAQTFGAGILPSEGRVFAQFARSAMEGRDIVLHTTGESEGNYVYTSDAIAGILLLLVKGQPGEAYNVSNPDSHITIRDMAHMVAHEIAGDQIKAVIDIPEDAAALGYAPPVKMWLDNSKLVSLGWQPHVGLAQAYRRMMRWMETM